MRLAEPGNCRCKGFPSSTASLVLNREDETVIITEDRRQGDSYVQPSLLFPTAARRVDIDFQRAYPKSAFDLGSELFHGRLTCITTSDWQ